MGFRGGGKTISCWLRKYGKNHLCPKVVFVEKPNEQSELRQMKQRIKQLEEFLGKTLKEVIKTLREEIARLKKDSSNSSKPPSSIRP
jgi:hypothetical protein